MAVMVKITQIQDLQAKLNGETFSPYVTFFKLNLLYTRRLHSRIRLIVLVYSEFGKTINNVNVRDCAEQ